MKWLKYRQDSRAGEGKWEYHNLRSKDFTEKDLEDMYGDIIGFLESYNLLEFRYYEYRIKWEIIDVSEVPKEIIEKLIRTCEVRIECAKRDLVYYKKLLTN